MERLILCGGGHVSLEVAHIARRLEFELVVICLLYTSPSPRDRG